MTSDSEPCESTAPAATDTTASVRKSLLDQAREIQAVAQSGLAFSKDQYDIERFKHLSEIAAELVAKHSAHSKDYLGKIFSAERGYATPKIDVRAAVFDEDRILLVKERDSSGWTLPGGYADVNESLSHAAEREVLEESGLSVKARKVAAIFDHRKHGYKPHLYHFYKIYVVCDLAGGTRSSSIETSESQYYSKTQVACLDLDPGRGTLAHILRMFDHRDAPELPADFD